MDQQNQHSSFEPQPPASLSGYALSSLSALAHGGASNSTFIPGEDPAHFFSLLENTFEQHKPGNDQDAAIVLDSVLARWYLSRRQRTHADYECQLHNEHSNPTYWSNDSLNRLNLFDRYQTTAERAFRRALVNVQTIRKQAMNDQVWQLKLATAKLKYEAELEKFEAAEARRKDIRKLKEDLATQAEENDPIHAIEEDEDGVRIIAQKVCIDIEDGQPVIASLCPSNQQVRVLLHQTKSDPNPPQRIHRFYYFENNIVPPEYDFLLTENNPVPYEGEDISDDDCYFEALSIAQWRSRAKTEVWDVAA